MGNFGLFNQKRPLRMVDFDDYHYFVNQSCLEKKRKRTMPTLPLEKWIKFFSLKCLSSERNFDFGQELKQFGFQPGSLFGFQ
jgi:hypothetical protein